MGYKKSLYVTSIIFLLALTYVATALSVDNNLTKEDIDAINSLNVSDLCLQQENKDFNNEIDCLSSIQFAVQSIGETRCALSSDTIEPADFLRRKYGCCFDRARFVEKAARYYGFETRHVFLIQPEYDISITNALPLGQSSHATSEILTSKGWLGVDSNERFILLDADNNPHPYSNALIDVSAFPAMQPKSFYTKNLDIIYGLYSRHGNFYGLNLPGPEYVFSELFWNWR